MMQSSRNSVVTRRTHLIDDYDYYYATFVNFVVQKEKETNLSFYL